MTARRTAPIRSPSSFSSVILVVLPVFAVIGVMAWTLPHPFAARNEPDLLAVPPSPAVDPAHVCELRALIRTRQSYDRRAARLGLPRPDHSGLTAEYALIVRETTPEAIRRAGLPGSLP